MKSPKRTLFSIAVFAMAVLGIIGISVLVAGDPVLRRSPHRVGLVDDWSFHRLVYSNPGTYEQIKNHPEKYARWLKIQYDNRYIMQQMKRRPRPEYSASALSPGKMPEIRLLGPPSFWARRGGLARGHRSAPKSALNNDWAENIFTGTVLPNMYPATFSANESSVDCANDYAAFPTGSPGNSLVANIVAFNNLYEDTCLAPSVPSVDWAYNTGTGYAVTTSPVISLDGSMIAYLQTNSSNSVQLVVLKWGQSGGSVTSPQPLTINPSNGMNCSAPCATVTTISSNGDAYSSPFYDFDGSDAIYFGDNASNLWKVTPVFTSTSLSPSVTSAMLNATSYDVASPVYDITSGCLFVGDSEGYFYSVDAGNYAGGPGEVCTSGNFKLYGGTQLLGNGGANEGIFDAPLVDEVAETVYAFVTEAGALGACTGKNCVMQFTAGPTGSQTITSGCAACAPANQEPLGTGGAGYNLYAGSFDNNYYSTGAGNLYVVGGTGLSSGGAVVYYVPVNSSNVMSSPGTGPTVNASGYPWPSPVTEAYDPNAVAATGTVTIATDPCTWTYTNNLGPNIVIGGTTYQFVDTAPGPASNNMVQVETVTDVYPCGSPTPNPNLSETADNLYAAINASTLCADPVDPGGTACYGSGASANSSATASFSSDSDMVSLTATVPGTAGNFTLTSSDNPDINVGGANNGAGEDLIFFSVNHPNVGGACVSFNPFTCVLAYDVTTTISSSASPTGTLVVGTAGCWGTSAITLDNSLAAAGASNVYFINLEGNFPSAGGANCTAGGTGQVIQATQAAQAGL